MPLVAAATVSRMASGTSTKASPGWRAGSGALNAVWRTVTASPRARSAPASCSIGLMWPWNGSGNVRSSHSFRHRQAGCSRSRCVLLCYGMLEISVLQPPASSVSIYNINSGRHDPQITLVT